jgi:hypothetical protein
MQFIPDSPETAVTSAISAKVGLAAKHSHRAVPRMKAVLSDCSWLAVRFVAMAVLLIYRQGWARR